MPCTSHFVVSLLKYPKRIADATDWNKTEWQQLMFSDDPKWQVKRNFKPTLQCMRWVLNCALISSVSLEISPQTWCFDDNKNKIFGFIYSHHQRFFKRFSWGLLKDLKGKVQKMLKWWWKLFLKVWLLRCFCHWMQNELNDLHERVKWLTSASVSFLLWMKSGFFQFIVFCIDLHFTQRPNLRHVFISTAFDLP